jgi:hypothetical protein
MSLLEILPFAYIYKACYTSSHDFEIDTLSFV